jgi:hypothetical protein
MPVRNRTVADETILRLKSEGLSFRDISKQLGKSLGSVTGRYYRLKGVRHLSQLERDAQLKRDRGLRRAARKKQKSLAAIQAAIELRNGVAFSVAVGRARAAGASLDMIGACCVVSKQALHKKWRGRGQADSRVGGRWV